MRIAATADTHGFLPDFPEADLGVVAGDFVPFDGWHRPHEQRFWVREIFAPWLKAQPVGHWIVIAGNHELMLQGRPGAMEEVPCEYLDEATTEYGGLKIFGSAWIPLFFDWAFMAEDEQLAWRWRKIPEDVDVLVTHGPPRGFGDRSGYGDRQAGSKTLRARLLELPKLQLHLFGHIHEDRGRWEWRFGREAGTMLANVSHVDGEYRPAQEPQVFEIG
jgi:hypothetical protein